MGAKTLAAAVAGVIALPGLATTPDVLPTAVRTAPSCVTYVRDAGGATTQTVRVMNQCRIAYTVRVDTVQDADSACVFVPPWQMRAVTIPYYLISGEVPIRGIAVC
jgi:hypothetical protein